MKSFWQGLPKPFFVMAPMADVTDAAFRALVAKRGAPDVFWTEFVSADGLYHTRPVRDKESETPGLLSAGVSNGTSEIQRSEGHEALLRNLAIGKGQHPIVAQIFSSKPEMITYAVKLVAELGFDGVDINMGCPDKSIEKQGCGSAMIKNPEVARAVIRAAKAAALEAYESQSEAIPNSSYRMSLVLRESPIPVSVKTRVGYNKESLDEWLPVLLEEAPAAITLHLRTRKQMSLVPADWELMKKAVALRDRINPDVLLIGNGDVDSIETGKRLVAESGCDGAMIGRGMFGNPWVFSGLARAKRSCKSENPAPSSRFDAQNRNNEDEPLYTPATQSRNRPNGGECVAAEMSCDDGAGVQAYIPTVEEKLAALVELAHNFEKISPPKSFAILKKHIKAFATGFDGAAHLRAQLMEAENAIELEECIKKGTP